MPITSKIKIEISALDTPILKDLGLYRFDDEYIEVIRKSDKNLADGESCKIEYREKEIDVNLGGLFPFNSVKATGVGDVGYKFYVFNGTAFDLWKEGRSNDGKIDISIEIPVDNAYRFMLSFDSKVEKTAKIEVRLV